MEGTKSEEDYFSEDVEELIKEDHDVQRLRNDFLSTIDSPELTGMQPPLQDANFVSYGQAYASNPAVGVGYDSGYPFTPQQQDDSFYQQQILQTSQYYHQQQQYSQGQTSPQDHQLPQWDITALDHDIGNEFQDSNSAPNERFAPFTLQPYSGRHNFSVSIPTDNKDKNKWCYSRELNKLCVTKFNAIPVDVSVDTWVDAKVRVMPLYVSPSNRRQPVHRCYNCKSTASSCNREAVIEHMVQVESSQCTYEELPNQHYAVSVPLTQPPPGVKSSLVLLMLTCRTSCIGGPNRREFCLVFTLLSNATGQELGRQIIQIKVCENPYRDLSKLIERSKAADPIPPIPAPIVDNKNHLLERFGDLASKVQVGQKRKHNASEVSRKHTTKGDPKTDSRFVQVDVPVEFEHDVKKYINSLLAKKYMKKLRFSGLLYSEGESEDSDKDNKP